MAKRFKFNLEVVRTIRRRAEEEQQRVVARKTAELVELEAQLHRLRDEVAQECRGKRDRQHAGPMDVDQLRRVQFYLGSLRRAIEDRERLRVDLVDALNVERRKLADRSAQRKVLDKLREKRWAAHRGKILKEEQAQTDEIGLQRFLRESRLARAGA